MGINLQLNAQIWWQGYGGLTLKTLQRRINHIANLEDAPSVIVIHCGGNDIGKTKTQKLLVNVQEVHKFLSLKFPSTKLVWSELLPRIKWRYSNNIRAMETTRARINRQGMRCFLNVGGAIYHPQFKNKDEYLFKVDGVHLSKEGNEIFCQNIKSGLQQFLKKC